MICASYMLYVYCIQRASPWAPADFKDWHTCPTQVATRTVHVLLPLFGSRRECEYTCLTIQALPGASGPLPNVPFIPFSTGS